MNDVTYPLAHICNFNNENIYSLVLFVISVCCVEMAQEHQEPETDWVLTQAIVIMSELKPWIAETVIGPDGVFTSSISTWMPLTLIDIYKETSAQHFGTKGINF